MPWTLAVGTGRAVAGELCGHGVSSVVGGWLALLRGATSRCPGRIRSGSGPMTRRLRAVGALDEPRRRRAARRPARRVVGQRRHRLSPGSTSTCCRGREYAAPVGLAGTGSRASAPPRVRGRPERARPPRGRPGPLRPGQHARRAPASRTRAGATAGQPRHVVSASRPSEATSTTAAARTEQPAQAAQPSGQAPSVAHGDQESSSTVLDCHADAFVCLRLHQTTPRIVVCQSFVHRPFGPGPAPGMQQVMSWEESMFAVFDDLEQQAEGLHLVERDAEVADLTVAEYSRVSLAARLHASLGRRPAGAAARRSPGRRPAGPARARTGCCSSTARRSGSCATRGGRPSSGLSTQADSEDTWSVVDRLTLRAVLRRLAAAGEACLVHFCDDQQVEGRVGRVGRDFFELHVGEGADGRASRWCRSPRSPRSRSGGELSGGGVSPCGAADPSTNGWSRTNCSASA